MTFSDALQLMKAGGKLARAGWNGNPATISQEDIDADDWGVVGTVEVRATMAPLTGKNYKGGALPV